MSDRMHFKTRVARKLYMKREAVATASRAVIVATQMKGGATSAGRRAPVTLRPSENPETFRYTAPHPGLATRRPALKQAKTSRGHSIFRGIILWHESLLELRVSYLLQTWHKVREIQSQYPRVTYIDAEGKTRTHTFDYYVVFEDGRRLAIAVKMDRKRAMMLDMLARIEEAGISEKDGRRLADETRLMTERDGTVASFHNCSEILASRETCDPAAEDELREIVRRMTGRFRFMTLLSGCQNVAARRAAIWRLIDLGELVPEGIGLIDELTWLIRDMANPMPSELS
ncbi:TnsA endonuclease N-terminal domain-containing protein [Rhizobium sullae]|uniref:TnsA endonuclease N-terminal domain-containing protein n=1 Tax=Rhizobium sullae TaxID=50338 RepID=UPI001FE11A32|nr:TnsA endonuclease N-terminal domain-containing protein [Rhizobium sullae]